MLHIDSLRHDYAGAPVLSVRTFVLNQGDHALVLGPSGSGKSTLLHLAAGVLTATRGEIQACGQPLATMPEAARDRFRGRNVGLVYQRLHLIAALTASANLALARYMAGLAPDADRINQALAAVGLQGRASAYPHELSQGQQQRVAIARALVNQPQLILADEPTSSLDDSNAQTVLDLLLEQAAEHGATLLIATHDQRIADRIPRKLQLNNHGQAQ